MKKLALLLISTTIFFVACQKSLQRVDAISQIGQDSLTVEKDTITYEVLTRDTVGWYGIWNDSSGALTGNPLDSGNYGTPIYLPDGWKFSFKTPSRPFQAFISVASFDYKSDITVNLYRNSQLVKTVTNDALRGFAKLLLDINTDTLQGTVADPVLTYEVLISNPDNTKFQSDGWIGQWATANGTVSDAINRLGTGFAIPSAWKYSFKPTRLPFNMRMSLSPYTVGGGLVTVHFYVNSQLVKSSSARDWMYGIEYTVR